MVKHTVTYQLSEDLENRLRNICADLTSLHIVMTPAELLQSIMREDADVRISCKLYTVEDALKKSKKEIEKENKNEVV